MGWKLYPCMPKTKFKLLSFIALKSLASLVLDFSSWDESILAAY